MIGINTNMGALRARDALSRSHALLQVSLERLSTGIRINRAEDDAAGVMQRDRFQAQINGLDEAIRNIQTGQGMIQVAEQGINKITDALQQMRALAVRAADDSLNDDDRLRIQEQIRMLLREINERAARTTYNGRVLLDGSIADSHAERLGSVQIQTNSILARGFNEISAAEVTGNHATQVNAISQGSYEVSLVFSGRTGTTAGPTTKTDLSGWLNSGPNGDGVAAAFTLNQIVTDRNGGSHVASFTFTQAADGARNYAYSVSIADGGVYKDQNGSGAQTFSGTMEFHADGTLKSVDGHPPGALQRSVTLQDGTATGQSWTIDFSAVKENQHDISAAASSATATSNGSEGSRSSGITLNLGSSLASTHNISDSVTTAAVQVFDRTGTDHSVSITFTKIEQDPVWTYQINGLSGGVWSGENSGAANGTLKFSDGGTLLSVNGASTSIVSLVIGDGTAAGQTVSLNFQNLSLSVSDSVAFTQQSGTTGNPTTSIQLRNNLLSGGASATPGVMDIALTVVDRTMDTVQNTSDTSAGSIAGGAGPRITFSQIDDTNTWNYTITAPTGSGFSGFGSGFQGQVLFDDAGNLVSLDGQSATFLKTINFADFTAEGQDIQLDFSQLNMARRTDLTKSLTDGGAGTAVGEVNAVIFFSDQTRASAIKSPVSTLTGLDLADRAYNAGGISFTVHKATTLDVGLKAFVKAYQYVSATSDSKGLQFQVGADEGQDSMVGIQKMDVDTIFRLRGKDTPDYDYTSITVATQLQAQDLIGQIDDALNFVGGENLKVGQFHNKLARTLDLQRQNMTSITGAFSNLNDADMAREATEQSKRSILVQSGTAMVAQANTQGQFLLQLLR